MDGPMNPIADARTTVTLGDYQQVRDETEALASPLSPEDQMIQSMDDVSPTKWHRAHITWFFETFLLTPYLPGYELFDDAFGYLYNSYYEAVGVRHPRSERGNVSRPSSAEVAAFRSHVDEAMLRLINDVIPTHANGDAIAELVRLGLHHEQQHQELLLMDIKHVLSTNAALRPRYHERAPAEPVAVGPVAWIDYEGGLVNIGHPGIAADLDETSAFHFDNEGPQH